jgi:hypothetical protein
MQVTAFEGVIENGQIRLNEKIDLPEKTKVYVIIPGFEPPKTLRIYSPRLAHPEQAVDFKKEVIEEIPNASV